MKSARNGWILVSSQSLSIAGDSLLMMVLPLMVLHLTGSVFQVSIVFILTQLPAFLGFLSGTLRRYFHPKSLIISYDLMRFLLLIFISISTALNYSIYFVYLLIFLFNFLSTLFRPTRMEYITHIVEQQHLQKFNSLDRTFEAGAYAIGFAIGGYAYFYLDLDTIFAFNSIPFLLSGLLLVLIKKSKIEKDDEETNNDPIISFIGFVKSLKENKVLNFLIYGEALAGLSFGIFTSLFVVYGIQHLGTNSIIIGNFEMIMAVSSTVIGIVLSFGLLNASERLLGLLGYLGMGVAMVFLGLNNLVWPTFLIVACIGVFNMMYSIAIRTLLQKNSAKNEMIHVFAYESILTRIALILGSALGGFIIEKFDVSVNWMILVSGFILLIVSIWTFQNLFMGFKKTFNEVERL